jgi:hypothetical protein
MKTYYSQAQNPYYYGPKYCPLFSKVRKISISNVANLPKEEDFTIVSVNKSDIGTELSKNFNGLYKEIIAKNERGETFKVFEVKCKKCSQK